jgi:hypothetical protein
LDAQEHDADDIRPAFVSPQSQAAPLPPKKTTGSYSAFQIKVAFIPQITLSKYKRKPRKTHLVINASSQTSHRTAYSSLKIGNETLLS